MDKEHVSIDLNEVGFSVDQTFQRRFYESYFLFVAV